MRHSIGVIRTLAGIVAALAFTLTFAIAPAGAEDSSSAPAPVQLEHGDQLDSLFAQLRVAPDPQTAQELEGQIWAIWLTPSDPDLRDLMSEALAARQEGDLVDAVHQLDKLVAEYPTYAEAWNQRATMYYMMGKYDLSLADCGKVLELEPRHFGALSGRALIYLAMGRRDLALKDIMAASAIHPFLPERQLFPELQPATHT